MFVTDKLQMPLPPRTGSDWVDQTMRYLGILCAPFRGKHRIPEPEDSVWDHIPGGLKRFTIIRESAPWLRSVYRTMYPHQGHMGIPPLVALFDIQVDSEDEFVERSIDKVDAVWDYYQPAEFVAQTENLAEGLLDALRAVGYRVTVKQEKVLRSRPAMNASKEVQRV